MDHPNNARYRARQREMHRRAIVSARFWRAAGDRAGAAYWLGRARLARLALQVNSRNLAA